jgi:hypothetical protein
MLAEEAALLFSDIEPLRVLQPSAELKIERLAIDI